MEGDNRVVQDVKETTHSKNTKTELKGNVGKTKLALVLEYLEKDLIAADLKWSLFIAACHSYRYDSCLKPFPSMYLKDDVKDIDLMKEDIIKIPALNLVIFLKDSEKCHLEKSTIDLLYWVLIQQKEPTLKSIPNSEIDNVLKLVPSELFAKRPDYIFKVEYCRESMMERTWTSSKENYDTLFAYHGSRLENFHSILNFGLQQHLNKNTLFGQGIYLSSELIVSLPYSQNGCAWGKSLIGSELSVVALCEMINHPTINCQSKDGSNDKSRAKAKDSFAGEVPHKFYLVPNSDLVRVRYLLVYSTCPPYPHNPLESRTFFGWLKEHKYATILIAYIAMLASVGFSHNQYIQRFYKMICHKIGLYF
uniref:Poly [ADP-ribose] polymerase n=1 Tax=Clastoptera arizonana TaxID=38151 RepID=A0A1B6C5N1_9HEMI